MARSTAGDVSETESGRSRFVTVIGGLMVLLVLLLLTLPFTIPVYATFSYRSAVHSLHRELRPAIPDTAQLVDEQIDSCWQDIAPASIRTFVPTAGVDESNLRALARDMQVAFQGKGFATTGDGRLSRERDDALDADIISIEVTDEEVRVVADVFDADSVFCPPG